MLSDQEQLDLTLRLRQGSREAWAALYENYSVAVWRYVARLLAGDAAGVADVVQEVFVAAAQSAVRFDPDRGTLWGWLIGIAHRQAALYCRKAERMHRWKKLAAAGAGEFRRWLDTSESPSEIGERRELADLVRGVLTELPADYAVLLTAKYLDERSIEELSQQLGGSIEAIKSKLARARREFRATFEKLVGTDQTASLS